jgi:hypothetical protein
MDGKVVKFGTGIFADCQKFTVLAAMAAATEGLFCVGFAI